MTDQHPITLPPDMGREIWLIDRAARRPKPPSLKEQALEALNEADQGLNESEWRPRSNTIRRALEALDD